MMDPYSMANLLMQAGYRPKAKRASRQVEELADALMTLGSSQVAMPVAGLVGGAAAPFVGAEGASEIIGDVQDRLTWRPRTERVQNAMQAFANAPPVQWLGQASQGLQQKAGDIGYELGGPLGGAIGSVVPTLAEEAISRGLSGMRKPRVKSDITVYHGTPHKFDAFDSSKIGTGEGAQVYGHGLYFAENPNVAKEYASLNQGRAAALDGWIDSLPPQYQMETFKALNMPPGWRRDAAIEALRENMPADLLPQLDQKIAQRPGSFYHVDLPDDMVDNMLDWDKPLSEQGKVLEALRNSETWLSEQSDGWRGAPQGMWDRAMKSPSKTGEWLYRELADNAPQGTAQAMQKLGITGIRYLDGGSRGTGAGTSNFVVFPGEEKRLRILRRE